MTRWPPRMANTPWVPDSTDSLPESTTTAPGATFSTIRTFGEESNMSSNDAPVDRRSFLQRSAAALAAGAVAAQVRADEAAQPAAATEDGASGKRLKVAVIGCGSVSTKYLPYLAQTAHVELVAACDRRFERAKSAATEHGIPDAFPHIDKLLAGAKFDMLVNLTDMQEHEHLNRQAVAAGKH